MNLFRTIVSIRFLVKAVYFRRDGSAELKLGKRKNVFVMR
jgi:hypothetical protein